MPAEHTGPGSSAAAPPIDTNLETLLADLRATLGELKYLGSERLRRLGVSMSHLHAMVLLDRHGPVAMSRFAELFDVSLSNATGLIDRMEERGLVERTRVPDDRRIVLVGLTDHGRRLLEEMDLLRDDLVTRVLGQLEPEHLAALGAAVTRLRDAIREVAAEARAGAESGAASPPTTDRRGRSDT